MTDLDQLLSQPRTRNVLRRIADGTHELMPCGDIRVARTLLRLDLLRTFDPRRVDFSTSYALTAKGRDAVAKHLPGTTLAERNLP